MTLPMASLGWLGIVRLGLVQVALGSIVVLVTSTLNRVMIVELALPAIVPGVLVGLHYAIQVLRPRLGFGSDVGGRRAPWIVGGIAALGGGSTAAAGATALMASHPVLGVALALAAFLVVGLGVGAAGTSLLTLVAKRVDPRRSAAAAAVLWIMMIAGIVLTSIVAGKLLDPFSMERLVAVIGGVSALALAVTALAVWGIEGAPAPPPAASARQPFMAALRGVWAEPKSRRFAQFVFASMLAYSMQDLVVEPFAGVVFSMSAGETTRLTGLHHGGMLAGMALVAVCSLRGGGFVHAAMRGWVVGGCAMSALAILLVALCGVAGPAWSFKAALGALGVANGAFAVSAIGAMMGLAAAGRDSREGTRMGLWGAAQALAFGGGGLLGTALSDVARWLIAAPASAYAAVFAVEAVLFLLAAGLAMRVFEGARDTARLPDGLAQGGVVQA